MNRFNSRVGISALLIGLTLAGTVASSSAQDAPDVDDLQETVEALSTEIAEIQYDSIPEVEELDQEAFDELLAEAQANDPVSGPEDGEIVHDADFIRLWYVAGTYDDFALDVTFENPRDEDDGPFDFGAELRIHGDYLNPARIYLIFDSDGDWLASVGTDDEWAAEEEFPLADGRVRGMDAAAGGENSLTIVMIGNEVHFAVNGEYISSFGVPFDSAGFLAIGTGFFTGSAINGETTPYRDLTVWEI